jgi:hypothetical protein
VSHMVQKEAAMDAHQVARSEQVPTISRDGAGMSGSVSRPIVVEEKESSPSFFDQL